VIRPPIPEAIVFGSRLREAMTKRAVSSKWLASQMDVSDTTVSNWRQGQYLPAIPVAERLSEVLDYPSLLPALVAARTRRCAYLPCSAVFQRKHDERRLFCSNKCTAEANRRHRFRANPRQTAIDAFCFACEPTDRICRDGDCPLRGFSPFLFVPLSRGGRVVA
jgi:DNA-binding XRE family transcriptional regulator